MLHMKSGKAGWNGDLWPDDTVLRTREESLGFLLLWFDGFWEKLSKTFQEFRLVYLKLFLMED